jgi:pimeloyl-ACP methyl ester carboxylesterase
VTDVTFTQVQSDGRRLDVLSTGTAGAPALVFHGGTPTAAVAFEPTVAEVTRHGFRYVTYSRPGYAGSDPQPGRRVSDAADDVTVILDELEIDEFVTVGWSGGGPHALACAALLGPRCVAAATIAAVAPFAASGLDWLAGMGKENHEEFGAALQGKVILQRWLEVAAGNLVDVTAEKVATAFGDLISEADRAALTGDFAEWMAASFRAAVSTGVAGWRDDDLAFLQPWGFELSSIDRPVFIWQGDQDRMVPFAHGQWLASQVGAAKPRLLRGEGHLSIGIGSFDRIVDELVAAAR